LSDSVTNGAQKARVLFVCTGNTCRSVLAEYIAKKKYARMMEASSAGLTPGTTADCANAAYTLKRVLGIDASEHLPRHVRELDLSSFDVVVAMTNCIAKELKELFPALDAERLLTWQISDPYGDNLVEYQRCAAKIDTKLKTIPVLRGRA
jgi:protein-tyrosine-phosphatase